MVSPNSSSSSNSNNLPPNNEWDTLYGFTGETNINSATGKERTFSEFDNYPKMKGETNEEYGARLKRMHEMTAKAQAEYEKKATKEAYQNSEQGKKEAEITAEFDRLSEKLDQAVREGKMSAEHAERLKELRLNHSVDEIAGIQQDYQDRQAIGDPEEEAKYRAWLEAKDAENMANLEKRGQEYQQIDDDYNIIDKEEPDSDEGEDDKKNKIEIGEIDITKIEQEFAEDKSERLAELEKKLQDLMPDVAELYAKNRRLIVGATNRANFVKVQGEYSKLLDEYLRLKGEKTFEAGKRKITSKIENRVEELRAEIESKLIEFAGGDLEQSEKTQEEIDEEKVRLTKEAEETLRKEYGGWIDDLKTEVNCNFLTDFIQQKTALEKTTTNIIDNGNSFRKFVNKVINNKALKGVLVGAAVAGLVVTGVGLVAAGATISLGFTAGGVAAGALKGGLSGLIMSRQNSKNSAVRGFANEEAIKNQIKEIDITKQDADTANVANWLMEQYGDASTQDRKSNIKKTAVSAGLGAALGGFASGIHINNVVNTESTIQQQIGNQPIEYNVDANLAQVNQPKGYGLYEVMRQMGVPEENWDQALEIAYKIEPNYGLSPGSNGVSAGFNGVVGNFAEAYPGPINTWPDTAQSFITETAREWARQGFIQAQQTGGEPIFNTITKVTTDYVPNVFLNFLTRATAVAGAGAIGGVIGGFGNTVDNSSSTRESSPETSSQTSTSESTETSQSSGETSSQSSEQLSQTEIDRNRFAENFANTFESLPQEEKTEILLALRELAEIQAAEQQEALNNETADENPETEATEEQANNENPETETTEEQANEPVIEQDLRELIGEAGVAALMDRNGDISSDEVDAVMGTLDQDGRNRVREWLDAHPDYGMGTRVWFEINDALQAE